MYPSNKDPVSILWYMVRLLDEVHRQLPRNRDVQIAFGKAETAVVNFWRVVDGFTPKESKMSLKRDLVRLAYTHPEFRSDILPLLQR